MSKVPRRAPALAPVCSLLLALFTHAASTRADEHAVPAVSLHPSATLDLSQLETVVRSHAPELEPFALDVHVASAAVTKSELLPDFRLDASWGTIPVGATNPRSLSSPFVNVPNYSVGLSYTLPLGKRGPLHERAQALQEAARYRLDAEVRSRSLQLAQLLGLLATTTMRLEGLRQLAGTAHDQVAAAQARVHANSLAGIEVDRLQVEASRIDQAAQASENDLLAITSACTAWLGVRCDAFDDATTARAFLTTWVEHPARDGSIAERPDMRALDADRDAANAEARFARAQAIPDPTVRIGYLRDQFVTAGNQLNSVNVSVSIPLPFFDHGQAELAAAHAKREHSRQQQDKLIALNRARVPALRQRLAAQIERHRIVRDDILPRAQATLNGLSRIVDAGLIPISDVIQARRVVSELIVDEAQSLGDAFVAALEIASETARSTP